MLGTLKYLLMVAVFASGLLGAGAAVDAKSILYLIRHAEKQDDGTRDPSLTEQGRARADWLGDWFAERGITAIYSSEFRRTLETVAPLSERLNLPIAPYNPRALEDLAERLRGEEGVILVSGHSNTTPALVNLLIGEERYPDLEEAWEYDYIFMVMLGDPMPQGAGMSQGKVESVVEIFHSEPRSVSPAEAATEAATAEDEK